jgi:hypothetical protein
VIDEEYDWNFDAGEGTLGALWRHLCCSDVVSCVKLQNKLARHPINARRPLWNMHIAPGSCERGFGLIAGRRRVLAGQRTLDSVGERCGCCGTFQSAQSSKDDDDDDDDGEHSSVNLSQVIVCWEYRHVSNSAITGKRPLAYNLYAGNEAHAALALSCKISQ